MPNWCDNQITITGDKSVIDKIEKIVKEEKDDQGLLNFFHPMPKELDGTTSPSSSADKPQPMLKALILVWYELESGQLVHQVGGERVLRCGQTR